MAWPDRIKSWADAIRDVIAVLTTPLLHLYVLGFGLALWLGGWGQETAHQRLQYLGWGFISAHALLAFALFWVRRTSVSKMTAQVGPTRMEIETTDAQAPRPIP